MSNGLPEIFQFSQHGRFDGSSRYLRVPELLAQDGMAFEQVAGQDRVFGDEQGIELQLDVIGVRAESGLFFVPMGGAEGG